MDFGLLNETFTNVKLVHILLILALPYFIFYLLDRKLPKGFDKFTKWEGGLFVFGIGGTLYFVSIYFFGSNGGSWFLAYLILLALLGIFLFLWYKNDFKPKKAYEHITLNTYLVSQSQKRRLLTLKLKNGIRYTGYFAYMDDEFIGIARDETTEMVFTRKGDKKRNELGVNEMFFKRSQVELFYL